MKLPDSWVEMRLADICVLNPRLSPDARPDEMTEVTFVPMSAVDGKSGTISKPEMRTFGEVSKGYTSFRENDVLFAKVTPCMENGKAAIAGTLVNGLGFGSTEFHVLRPTGLVLPEYIFHFIRQEAFRERAASAFVGTGGLQRVPPEFLSRIKLPLPTIPEQQRIVDVLRQAEQGVVRNQQLRHQQLDLMIKAALDRLVLAVDFVDWVSLGEVVETRYGTSMSADATVDTGTPVLRIPNVMGGEVDTTDMKYVELPQAELKRLRLAGTDLLIVRSNGNPDYVGRSAPITEDLTRSAMVYASYLIRLRTDTARLLPEYLSAFLNSAFGRAAMRNAIRTTAGQSNLSGENLTKIRLPIPALAEQEQFRKFWLEVKALRQLISESERTTEVLRKALSIYALSGDLTADWRLQNREEIAAAAATRDALLRERGAKLVSSPSEPALLMPATKDSQRPARQWLLAELSEFQRQVLIAFLAYPEQPLLAEDADVFAHFCDDENVLELLKDFGPSLNNRIRRTLSQLSSLGLIAKVTLPKQNSQTGERDYLKAFRPLREDEYTKMADVETLRRALSSGDAPVRHSFTVVLDYETSEHAGAGGMFQVSALSGEDDKDRTDLVDQGKHYAALDELASDIAGRLGVRAEQIELGE